METTHDKARERAAYLLKDHTAEWTERKDALGVVRAVVQSPSSSNEFVLSYLTALQPSLCIQLDDRRSIYCKEVCDLVTIAARKLGDKFESLSTGFMVSLFQLLVVTIRVIAESAHKCILSILPFSTSAIPVISQGVRDKHPFLRARCTEYMCTVLESTPAEKLNNDSYLIAIDEAVRSAIADSNAEARALAKRSYQAFNKRFPELAQKLVNSLESSLQKRLVETTSKPAARKGGFAEFLAKKQGAKPTNTDNEGILVADVTTAPTSPNSKHTDDNDKDGSSSFSSSSSTTSSTFSASSTSTTTNTTSSTSTTTSPAATQSHTLAIVQELQPIALDMPAFSLMEDTELTPTTDIPTETILPSISHEVVVEHTIVQERPLTPMDVTPTTFFQEGIEQEINLSPSLATSPDIFVDVPLVFETVEEELLHTRHASEPVEAVGDVEKINEAVEEVAETTLSDMVNELLSEAVEESVHTVAAEINPLSPDEPTSASEEPISASEEPISVSYEAEAPAVFEIAVAEAPAVEITDAAITVAPVSISIDLSLLPTSSTTPTADVTPEVDVAAVTRTEKSEETDLNMEPELAVLSDAHSSAIDNPPALSELLSETEQAPAALPAGKRPVIARPSSTVKVTSKTTTKPPSTTTTKLPLKPAVPTAITTRSSTPTTMATRSSTPTLTTTKAKPATKPTIATKPIATTQTTTKPSKTTSASTKTREPLKTMTSNDQEGTTTTTTTTAKDSKKVTRTAYSSFEDKENQINVSNVDAHPPAKKLKVTPPPPADASTIAARVKTRRAATTSTSSLSKTSSSSSKPTKSSSKPTTSSSSSSKVAKSSSSKRPTWV